MLGFQHMCQKVKGVQPLPPLWELAFFQQNVFIGGSRRLIRVWMEDTAIDW